jgi:putative beta-barrel porin BBP2
VPGQAPAFPGGPIGSGIQTPRVTTYANSGKVVASYILAPKVLLSTNYTNYFVSFGGTASGQSTGVPVFGFLTHAIGVGPTFKITPRDTLEVKYTFAHSDYTSTTPTVGGTFSTHGGTVGWTRQLTQTLSGTVTGGTSHIDLGDAQQSGASSLVYIASASLQWNYEKNSAATLSYSRSVTPGFFGVPVPLITDTVNVSASRILTQKLRIIGTANYAHNEDTASLIRFISYGGTVSLSYDLARSVTASLNYIYYNYDSKFISQIIAFDRSALMLSLRMAWN